MGTVDWENTDLKLRVGVFTLCLKIDDGVAEIFCYTEICLQRVILFKNRMKASPIEAVKSKGIRLLREHLNNNILQSKAALALLDGDDG